MWKFFIVVYLPISFIQWFDCRQDREISCNREFNEELINTGILDKEKFINSYKPNDITVRNEIEEEIISCYKLLNYYGITEEVLIKNELIDKEKIELLKEIGKLTDNEKEIESIDISFNYTDGTEYKYKFTKNKEKESTAPSWLRDVVK